MLISSPFWTCFKHLQFYNATLLHWQEAPAPFCPGIGLSLFIWCRGSDTSNKVSHTRKALFKAVLVSTRFNGYHAVVNNDTTSCNHRGRSTQSGLGRSLFKMVMTWSCWQGVCVDKWSVLNIVLTFRFYTLIFFHNNKALGFFFSQCGCRGAGIFK